MVGMSQFANCYACLPPLLLALGAHLPLFHRQASGHNRQADGRASSPPRARPPTRRRRNPLRRLSNKSRLRRRRRKVQSGIVFISPSGEGKRDPNAALRGAERARSLALHAPRITVNEEGGKRERFRASLTIFMPPFPYARIGNAGIMPRTRSHMNFE